MMEYKLLFDFEISGDEYKKDPTDTSTEKSPCIASSIPGSKGPKQIRNFGDGLRRCC